MVRKLILFLMISLLISSCANGGKNEEKRLDKEITSLHSKVETLETELTKYKDMFNLRINNVPFKAEQRILLKDTGLHIIPHQEANTLQTLKSKTIVSVGDAATTNVTDEIWLYVTTTLGEEPGSISGWIKKTDTEVINNKQSPVTNASELKDELIIELINSGLELYSLFEVDSLPYNSEIRKKFPDLIPTYYLVNAENINTITDLKKMLTTVFTEELAEKLLKSYDKVYVEDEGRLYTWGLGGEGPYIFWDEILVKEKEAIDQDTIIAHVYLLFPSLEKIEPLTYNKEKFEFKKVEGQWRLNSFYLVK